MLRTVGSGSFFDRDLRCDCPQDWLLIDLSTSGCIRRSRAATPIPKMLRQADRLDVNYLEDVPDRTSVHTIPSGSAMAKPSVDYIPVGGFVLS